MVSSGRDLHIVLYSRGWRRSGEFPGQNKTYTETNIMNANGRRRTVTRDAWLCAIGDPGWVFEAEPRHGYQRRKVLWSSDVVPYPMHLIYFVADGHVGVEILGNELDMGPGSAAWFQAEVPHAKVIPADTTYYYCLFDFRCGSETLRLKEPYFFLPNAWDLLPIFEQIIGELDIDEPYKQERVCSLFALLSIGMFSILDRTDRKETVLSFGQRQTLTRFVAERISERIRPADLAAEVRLCPAYFARIFRRTYGMSPRAWLVHERIRLAANRLVESSQSVQETAYEFGYENPYLFSRQFKQIMGVSPRTFRATRS